MKRRRSVRGASSRRSKVFQRRSRASKKGWRTRRREARRRSEAARKGWKTRLAKRQKRVAAAKLGIARKRAARGFIGFVLDVLSAVPMVAAVTEPKVEAPPAAVEAAPERIVVWEGREQHAFILPRQDEDWKDAREGLSELPEGKTRFEANVLFEESYTPSGEKPATETKRITFEADPSDPEGFESAYYAAAREWSHELAESYPDEEDAEHSDSGRYPRGSITVRSIIALRAPA